eukprot:scaffold434_cov186-Pinguiococcus_pyrenoidosus.AAC.137
MEERRGYEGSSDAKSSEVELRNHVERSSSPCGADSGRAQCWRLGRSRHSRYRTPMTLAPDAGIFTLKGEKDQLAESVTYRDVHIGERQGRAPLLC